MNRAARIAFPFALALTVGADTRIKLPTSRADLASGEKLFQVHCALLSWAERRRRPRPRPGAAKTPRAPDDAALLKVIEDGIRGTEMPGAGAMSEHETRQTAAYVRSLGKVPEKPVPGNAAHGAEIYRGKAGCASCHSHPRRGRDRGTRPHGDRRLPQRGVSARIAGRSAEGRSRRATCWSR